MRLALPALTFMLLALIVSGTPEYRETRGSDRARTLELRDILCGTNGRPVAPLQRRRTFQESMLPEHTDHDCHWNEREPEPYYWFWGRGPNIIMNTSNPADTPPPGEPPPMIPPGATSGSELEIRKWPNARIYNQAVAEDFTQGTGLQQTTALLRWCPSPTWRASVVCCHSNECDFQWLNNLYATFNGGLANQTDYPKDGKATFGTATNPCATQAYWYSSGCEPLGIPEMMAGCRVEFWVWFRLQQDSEDGPVTLTGGGSSQDFDFDAPPDTGWVASGPPESLAPTQDELDDAEAFQVFEGVYNRQITDILMRPPHIHKTLTYLRWNNWILVQEAEATNCRVLARATFMPTALKLYDMGILNHFTVP